MVGEKSGIVDKTLSFKWSCKNVTKRPRDSCESCVYKDFYFSSQQLRLSILFSLQLKLGAGTSDGGFQIQSLKQYHHGSNNAIVQTNIAHGSLIHVTVIAENCAGLRSTFKANPVEMDHTVPVIDNVHSSVKFSSVDSSGTSESNVIIDASWQVNDEESGVKICFCALGILLSTFSIHQP